MNIFRFFSLKNRSLSNKSIIEKIEEEKEKKEERTIQENKEKVENELKDILRRIIDEINSNKEATNILRTVYEPAASIVIEKLVKQGLIININESSPHRKMFYIYW